MVDLDTIDLSNLNRQFLFSREHIGRPKAVVAKETASKFNPSVQIVAHHSNIMADQFNIKWFRSFDIVYNALDNKDARRHVNNMCLASDVPLIESGTTGFDGYVQVIVGDKTECFDCLYKEAPKSYPVCTIRSTPSQPVHCVVWSKSFLFSQLFEPEEDSGELQNGDDAETAEERETLVAQANELKDLRNRVLEPTVDRDIIDKLFKRDVEQLLTMDSMWKERIPPIPLDHEGLQPKVDAVDASKVIKEDQRVWTLAENVAVFKYALKALQARLKDSSESIFFDKDDEDTLNFVVAATNIRSTVFSIETKSKFDIKQIAGNIIPAIATTNAVTAGVCVLQSLKVVANALDSARNVYLSHQPDKIFSVQKVRPPNPECPVSNVARATIEVDPSKATLRQFIDSLLKQLEYDEDFSILTDKLLYDADFDDNADRTFADLNIGDGTFITVIDDDDDTHRVNLQVYVQAGTNETIKIVKIPSSIAKKPVTKEEEDITTEGDGTKRKLEETDATQPPGKRPKLDEVLEETIVISDDEEPENEGLDGVIILDDD